MVTTVEPPPEPPETLADPAALLEGYLDFYRDAVLRKLDGLSDEQLRRSSVPSGWTPLELLKHLAFVELRWMRWGFAAEQIDRPWADNDPHDHWYLEPGETTEEVEAFFRRQCTISREITARSGLAQKAAVGGRFANHEQAPTLAWILCHLLQEYARHVGHLDIARELCDGTTGE